MFDGFKDRQRLADDLREAQEPNVTQKKEIEKLLEAVAARNEVLRLMAEALIEAGMWIDPIMQGPLTATGEDTRRRLQEKIEHALYLGGFSKPEEKDRGTRVARWDGKARPKAS